MAGWFVITKFLQSGVYFVFGILIGTPFWHIDKLIRKTVNVRNEVRQLVALEKETLITVA